MEERVKQKVEVKNKAKAAARPPHTTDKTEEAFHDFVNGLDTGLEVTHKSYGSGMIVAMDDTNVIIRFGDVEKKFNLGILFVNRLLL